MNYYLVYWLNENALGIFHWHISQEKLWTPCTSFSNSGLNPPVGRRRRWNRHGGVGPCMLSDSLHTRTSCSTTAWTELRIIMSLQCPGSYGTCCTLYAHHTQAHFFFYLPSLAHTRANAFKATAWNFSLTDTEVSVCICRITTVCSENSLRLKTGVGQLFVAVIELWNTRSMY